MHCENCKADLEVYCTDGGARDTYNAELRDGSRTYGGYSTNIVTPEHFVHTLSPKNDYVLVCDLGDDAIEVIPIAPSADTMLGTPVRVGVRAGSGPRHVAFHPNGKWVYCIHEVDCTIDLFDWNAGRLMWRAWSVISTLAKGVPCLLYTSLLQATSNKWSHIRQMGYTGCSDLSIFPARTTPGMTG